VPQTFPVSVKGVVLDSAHRALLLKNERDEWELPGGRTDVGETPGECVVREVFEETRWKVRTGPVHDTWMCSVAGKHVFVVTYGCFPETDADPVLSREHHDARLFNVSEVDGLDVPDGYRRSITRWVSEQGSGKPLS
jgi:8-oxo-dGTP pyrophosphatase MutT (NUDIX family)